MKCVIAKWESPREQPVPEAVFKKDIGWVIEVDDLFVFCEKHKSRIQLIPPNKSPGLGEWFIWITKRKFIQS